MKKYVEFIKKEGFPAGNKTFYECTICHSVITSVPEFFISCKCSNIEVDATAGRVIVKDKKSFKIFVEK